MVLLGWLCGKGRYLPVPQLFLCDGDLLHMPEHLSLDLLPVLGNVAQADAGDVTNVLGGEVKTVDTSATLENKITIN